MEKPGPLCYNSGIGKEAPWGFLKMRRDFMKKWIAALLSAMLLLSALPGAMAEVDKDIKATLTIAIWDNLAYTLYDELDLQGRFQKHFPNVEIEVEKVKDDSEYWNAMKIRASANQLPDLMFNKTFTLARFKDYLLDLTDTQATANNLLAKGYAVDGKVLGVPMQQGGDYVYYWEDMYEEAGVAIPQTWSEFVAAAETVQAHFGAADPDFMAIAMGVKDEWPDYPFVEFMPAAQNGDGQNWNTMATLDAPFAEGTNMYATYTKIYDLFSKPVFGKDPLGIGHDQAAALFSQRKAAMIVSGSWCLDTILTGAADTTHLRTYYMPFRDVAADPFRYTVQGDSFLSVTKHSENPELAMAFLEFFFSDEWYPDYNGATTDDSTMIPFPKEKHAVLQYADAALTDELVYVTYDGGGDDFTAMVSETQFDYKKLGAMMFTEDFDLQATFQQLNDTWAAAREKLGLK